MGRDDSELVMACRRGDDSAWEEIVYRYQNLLYSIPRRSRLSADLASDVLQDVFMTLYRKLDKLEHPEFLRAWLVTTTRHRTLQMLASERRAGELSIDDQDTAVPEPSDTAPLADEAMIEIERQLQIESALTQIDDRCRQLLTMLYLAEETTPYTEVSQELGIPLGSIGPTRGRCLEKLLRHIPAI